MRRMRMGGFAGALAAGALTAVMAAMTGPAAAQTQFESVSTQRDWFVFESGSGASRVCWIVSQPKSTVARRNNQPVQVNRGDIYMMVANRPGANVRNEVSMITGYTFRQGSTVRLDIGGTVFELFTDGDKAWAENAAADERIVTAMKGGTEAKLTGTSSRGTTTTDTYSLLGFTAALDEAATRCR